jgi:hypothetical protein
MDTKSPELFTSELKSSSGFDVLMNIKFGAVCRLSFTWLLHPVGVTHPSQVLVSVVSCQMPDRAHTDKRFPCYILNS